MPALSRDTAAGTVSAALSHSPALRWPWEARASPWLSRDKARSLMGGEQEKRPWPWNIKGTFPPGLWAAHPAGPVWVPGRNGSCCPTELGPQASSSPSHDRTGSAEDAGVTFPKLLAVVRTSTHRCKSGRAETRFLYCALRGWRWVGGCEARPAGQRLGRSAARPEEGVGPTAAAEIWLRLLGLRLH